MANFKDMTSKEIDIYFIELILLVLQEVGGELSRYELKERICDLDDEVSNYYHEETVSKRTGHTYKKFNFSFNFAINRLSIVGLIKIKTRKIITLTESGLNLDLKNLNVEKDIFDTTNTYWEEARESHVSQDVATEDNEEIIEKALEQDDDLKEEDKIKDIFKEKLLGVVAKMTPRKFEAFSRALLNRMGVEFSDNGLQISDDGGIEGYGYRMDSNDFRITRVVIECKRYNTTSIPAPDIDKFRGVMSKYQADYGVL